MDLRGRVLLLGAFAAGCSQPQPLAEPRVHVLEACEIEFARRIPPVVMATVDGRPDLAFLVDTGADTSSVDLAMAEALGFPIRPYSRSGSSKGADGRAIAFEGYVPMERIEIGSVLVEGLGVPAIDSDVTRLHGWFGILGQDVLKHVILVLDAERGRLHALPPSTDQDGISSYLKARKIGTGAWVALDVDFRPCPFLVFDVDGLEGGKMEMEVDTGATSTSLPAPAIAALGLEEIGTFSAHGIAGVHEGRTFRLEDLGLVGLKISGEVHEAKLAYGLFGMDVLGLLVIVLDAPHGRIWFHNRAGAEER